MNNSPGRRHIKLLDSSIDSSIDISDASYNLSVAYVQDALQGRYYNAGLGKNIELGKRISIWCLRITSNLIYTTLLFLVVGFHCMISLAEPVQMIAVATKPIARLPFWGGVSCCVLYLLDVLLELSYCHPKQYFSFNHGRFTGLVMMGVTPKFLQFLLILGGYVVGFAVIGVHLFMDVYDDNDVVKRQHEGIYEGAFDHIGIAILEVFVLMTGELLEKLEVMQGPYRGSYPRFMIPPYDRYGPIVLSYFVTVLMTGEIILYGILVARIYDYYIKANKKHVKEERHHERQCLIKAFEILDFEKTGNVQYNRWKGLMRILRPKASSSEIRKRFRKLKELAKHELPDNGRESGLTQSISVYEFFYLPNVLQFTVEKNKPKRSFHAGSENTNRFNYVVRLTRQKIFTLCCAWCNTRFAYYVSLMLNLLFVLPFVLVWYGVSLETSRIMFGAEAIIISIIALDIVVQVIALGIGYMLHEMPLHIITVLVAIGCLTYIRFTDVNTWNEGWAPVLAYLCMLLRLSGFKRKSSSMFHWLRRIAPPLFTLLWLICIGFYSYGIIGMECFGYLRSDEYLPEGVSLCRYGFESLGCSLLTLFQISLGSSWHKVMHYIMEEVDLWACVYFVFFYTLMQMLVLNVISAIMVELSNAIYNDENEAKQRDKEYETREETNFVSRNLELTMPGLSPRFSNKKISSASNTSIAVALSMTTGMVAFENSIVGSTSSGTNHHSLVTSPCKTERFEFRKPSQDSPTTTKHVTLPCIVEEDMTIEDVDEVTLTGRKELGNWTRDIIPDMTFLNAEDLRRLHAEMGKSLSRFKLNTTRKRSTSQSSDISEITAK
ncbi:unnamed protein product [Clavelina lepadiformis]|uniref:Ion transport domain-containing protein n=1 Tax=Clavelina lepadiformis TaxID=159417 RepID=A0ABP0FL68_CLALP